MTHTQDVINPLIKEVFGRRCRGNFLDAISSSGLIETDRLEVIADKGIGNILFGYVPFFFPKVIGKFDSRDGSAIRVMPGYIEQAKRYARTYKEKFGREVTITSDDQADKLQYVHAWA